MTDHRRADETILTGNLGEEFLTMPQVNLYSVGDVGIIKERPEPVFGQVSRVLHEADILFGNLEAPISNRGEPGLSPGSEPSSAPRSFPLRSDPSTLSSLQAAGFHVLSLANNHAMDFGPYALLDCINRLDRADIACIGAGADLQAALRPVVLERKDIKIAFLAYNAFFKGLGRIESSIIAGHQNPGVAPIRVSPYFPPPHVARQDLDQMQASIENALQFADHVVVSCHWGAGFSHELAMHQQAIGRAAIDAGAVLVVGHHPHILQGIECYHGGLICYSLGEFGFDLPYNVPGARETILLKCSFSPQRLEHASFLVAVMNEFMIPKFVSLDSQNGHRIVGLMQRLSGDLHTILRCEDGEVHVQF